MNAPAVLLVIGLASHLLYRLVRIGAVEVFRFRRLRKRNPKLLMLSSAALLLWMAAQVVGYLFVSFALGYIDRPFAELAAVTLGFFALPTAIFMATVCGIQALKGDLRAPMTKLLKPYGGGSFILGLWSVPYAILAATILWFAVSGLETWRWLAVPTVAMAVVLIFVALKKGRYIVSPKSCMTGRRFSLLIWEV